MCYVDGLNIMYVDRMMRVAFSLTLYPFLQSFTNGFNQPRRLTLKTNLFRHLGSMTTSPTFDVQLVVPESSLADAECPIQVSGLVPHQEVIITSSTKDEGIEYIAHAQYKASEKGAVDLASMASTGGSYQGVEPMGLFWSMKAVEDGEKKGFQFRKKYVETPSEIHLSVMNKHENTLDRQGRGTEEPLVQKVIQRIYMASGVQKIPVRVGRIRATLFLPPGTGPFPGVIDMFGTAGGLIEFRAAQFASRGFASLALAFFRYDDLPEHLNLDLEYFEEAVEWFAGHPSIMQSGIGVLGISKGAELALFMAITSKKVKAVVSIASYNFYSTAMHTYKGKSTETVIPDFTYVKQIEDGFSFRNCYLEDEAHIIPVEHAGHAQFLLIHGEDDGMADPECSRKIAKRLQDHGLNNYTLVVYPRTGHLIYSAHIPVTSCAYHRLLGSSVYYGGGSSLHAKAQVDAWQKTLAFFRENLQPRDNRTNYSRL